MLGRRPLCALKTFLKPPLLHLPYRFLDGICTGEFWGTLIALPLNPSNPGAPPFIPTPNSSPSTKNSPTFVPLKKQRPHEEASGNMAGSSNPKCGENLVNETQSGGNSNKLTSQSFVSLKKDLSERKIDLST